MKQVILLIGCGRFGKNHLRVLKRLHTEGQIILKGVITAREESRKKIAEEYQVSTFSELNNELLASVDAVDIVTPASTHFSIIKQCLPYCDVLVEKPLALSSEKIEELQILARKHQRKVMVGHIFRFNKAVQDLKRQILPKQKEIKSIKGKFVGKGVPSTDCGAIPTYLHLFDILFYIFDKNPKSISCKLSSPLGNVYEDLAEIILAYDHFSANLKLGWVGDQKERSFLFSFDDDEIFCNLLNQRIKIGDEIISYPREEPLLLELEHFINILNGEIKDYPSFEIALKIQKVIDCAYESAKNGLVVEISKKLQ